MPNIYVFAVLNVQVRIFSETDKIKLKTQKPSTRVEKDQKPMPGSNFQVRITYELNLSYSTFKNYHMARIALGV